MKVVMDEIIETIGAMDNEELDNIAAMIKLRRNYLSSMKGRRFKVNDRVVFNDNVSPKYMAGAKATVTKVNSKTVVVDLDKPSGRFGKTGIRVPFSLVDKV